MLKTTDKDKLKKLGIDIDAIIAANNDASEKDIVVPDGELLTTAQLEARDKNIKADGVKDGKKEGEKAGLTLAVTEIAKHTGLTIDATKIERFGDLGVFLKEELGKNADQKTQTLTKQNTDLISANELLVKERDSFKGVADTTKFEYDQYKHFPANRTQIMNEGEVLNMLKGRGVDPKVDGVYRDGVLMTDAVTKAPLPHKAAYETLFTEFKLMAEPPAGAAGGRGGGNSSVIPAGGKPRNATEAEAQFKAANPNGNIISPEYDAYLANAAKDNPTFSFAD